ncbi:glycosyltransferase [Ilumatobacter sp.]|uniref:glycosyltransferase n=1 Tax=Ilumatobacter sp. TaxID=1967498 RepID=UPI003B518025
MTLPSFGHVLTMCDRHGMFEHAEHATPRPEHGYCTDDVARLLIVAVREGDRSQAVRDLRHLALRFLTDAQGVTGRVRNRRGVNGRWHGRRGVEDCWGRSLWAFGTAAGGAADESARSTALSYFDRGATQRSPHRRAMAFASLGAAEVLAVDPRRRSALDLLTDAVDVIGRPSHDASWPWPEPRLSYANAALADALVAAGHALDRPEVVDDGLALLAWLLERETLDGHLSPTPVGGAGPGDDVPRFDQQPIEVAALADACHRAHVVTGDGAWRGGVELAIGWFEGRNDLSAVMWDPVTHGGYDGLTPNGPNLNQGAESTLALISTMQHGPRPTDERSEEVRLTAPGG